MVKDKKDAYYNPHIINIYTANFLCKDFQR